MIFVQVRDTHSLIYSGAQMCVGGEGAVWFKLRGF